MSDLLSRHFQDMHQKTSNLHETLYKCKTSNYHFRRKTAKPVKGSIEKPVKGSIHVCFRGAISVKKSFYYVWFNEYACIISGVY